MSTLLLPSPTRRWARTRPQILMVPVLWMMVMNMEIIIGMRQRRRRSVVELVVRMQQWMICHVVAVVVFAHARARGRHFGDGGRA
jgi:hypothetical protein